MNTLTIPAEYVRAAQICQATGDVRKFLNGIHITTDGLIHGTNGHVLYQGKWTTEPTGLETDCIIKIAGSIPANATTVTFYRDQGMCKTDNKKAFTFELLEGQYPDIDRAIPNVDRPCFDNGFVVAAGNMITAMKALGGRDKYEEITCHHGRGNESVVFMANDDSEFARTSLVVVMPVRNEREMFIHADTRISEVAA